MKTPWIDNSLKFLHKPSGLRIEEIKEPWDLYLEGHFLNTSIGSSDHIEWVLGGKQQVFSIRNANREPVADIICMPEGCKRTDSYWSRLRILETSSPMQVKDKNLIVLTVLCRNESRVPDSTLEVVKDFFTNNNGKFGNEHPFKVDVKNNHDLRKWQKQNKNFLDWNLCIGSKYAFIDICQTHVFNKEDAIKELRAGIFDYIYIRSDDFWTEEVLDHLSQFPADLPRRDFILFGHDDQRRGQYVKRAGNILTAKRTGAYV